MSKDSNKAYTFTIQNGAVTRVSEIKNGRAKLEKMDADEVWSYDANTNQVVKIDREHGRVQTTVYTDANGDGLFDKASKSTVALGTTGTVATTSDWSHPSDSYFSTASQPDGYQFTIINGAVAAIFEVEHGGTKAKAFEFGESWSVVGNQIIKTDVERGLIATSVYADSNADGIFTNISTTFNSDLTNVLSNIGDRDARLVEGHADHDHLYRGVTGTDLEGAAEHTLILTGVTPVATAESTF